MLVDEIPFLSSRPAVGVAITTFNNQALVAKAVAEFRRYTPDAVVVVVDDGSYEPVPGAAIRFDEHRGKVRAANAGIELLMAVGCEHLFLSDDETYPVAAGWFDRYIASPEPHLMYLFEETPATNGQADSHVVYRDDRHVARDRGRGCLLYMHRSVVDQVGGMRWNFRGWDSAHTEYSSRIHAAGLTTNRFQDVTGSDKLIFALKEHTARHHAFGRSADNKRGFGLVQDEALSEKYRGSTDFEPYYPTRNVVVTSLPAPGQDQRRGSNRETGAALLNPLRTSIKGAGLVVLPGEQVDQHSTDTDGASGAGATTIVETRAPGRPETRSKTATGADCGFRRHIATWQWLRANRDVEFVWCVDSVDVVMLNRPWQHMRKGRLYVGSETKVVAMPWMRARHPAQRIQEFIDANPGRQLLDAGVIGGDRETVMAFLNDIVRLHMDNAADVAVDKDDPLEFDQGVFNFIAWTKWADHLEWGSRVNSVYGRYEKNNWSWWAHK